MNEAAYVVYVGMFLALPPALLTMRWFDRVGMPWLLLLASSAIGGWLLMNLAQMFYVNDLLLQIPSRDRPYAETSDFSAGNFLFQFGWLFGPVYLMPWLFLYCVLVFARWLVASRA